MMNNIADHHPDSQLLFSMRSKKSFPLILNFFQADTSFKIKCINIIFGMTLRAASTHSFEFGDANRQANLMNTVSSVLSVVCLVVL